MKQRSNAEFGIHRLPVIRGVYDIAAHANLPPKSLGWMISGGADLYSVFAVPKKSGGRRLIANPHPLLKQIQRWILRSILDRLDSTSSCFGFEPGSKLRSNAEQHLGARAVLTLDLASFFPSIPIARVVRVFRVAGYASTGAWLLARLCTWHEVLPQGAPTSPKLANLVCYRMDRRLAQFARSRRFTYTRYADDLTFSAASMNSLSKARNFISHIVIDSGFSINADKTRLIGPCGSKSVTGLIIALDDVGIGRRRLRRLRARIHKAQSAADGDELRSLQGVMDQLSDVDMPRYLILARYIERLRAQPDSPLTMLRIRPLQYR